MPAYPGPHGETPGWIRRQKEQGESMGKNLFCGFHGKEGERQGKQAKQVWDWLA